MSWCCHFRANRANGSRSTRDSLDRPLQSREPLWQNDSTVVTRLLRWRQAFTLHRGPTRTAFPKKLRNRQQRLIAIRTHQEVLSCSSSRHRVSPLVPHQWSPNKTGTIMPTVSASTPTSSSPSVAHPPAKPKKCAEAVKCSMTASSLLCKTARSSGFGAVFLNVSVDAFAVNVPRLPARSSEPEAALRSAVMWGNLSP
jgi:hypothetical protein